MTEEIKEIIECLKYHGFLSTSQDSYLLDYITDLEQENKSLKQENKSLKQENTFLKNILRGDNNEHKYL